MTGALPFTRFAAIADIHGNSDALIAVLDDIDALGIETIVNLGDHFSGPLAAGESAEILLARDMLSIRGNHDRWILDVPRAEMGASDRLAAEQLTDEALEWLRSLKPSIGLRDEIFLCHGTPQDDTTYWMEQVLPGGVMAMAPQETVERAAQGLDFPVILCAHTHTPRAMRLADNRLLVNPGSVGCPGYGDDAHPIPHVMQTGTSDASYAVLENSGDGWRVSFRNVPYDSRRMARLASEAGRPDWARAVATGWIRP